MPQEETVSPAAEALSESTDQTPGPEQSGDLPAVETDTTGDDPAALRAQLDQANQRADAEHEAHLRALADFSNYKRRVQDDAARQRELASEKILLGLLPVVDNFERALQSAGTTRDYDKLVSGVNAILRQMQEFLSKSGVEAIESVGQPFDPNIHNAVLRHETTEHPENTVVEELQKGYTLGGRVLRPSMVKVATGTE